MKRVGCGLSVLIALVIAVIVTNAAYIVDETEQVVITEFGEPVGGPVREPGLHWKKPFVQRVNAFERRIMPWDGEPKASPTKDKKYIFVDTFARWKIADPLQFLKAVREERMAHALLDDIIDSATRIAVSSHELIEVVRDSGRPMLIDASLQEATEGEPKAEPGAGKAREIRHGRTTIMKDILARARGPMSNYGIELVDVQIKRVNYVKAVREKVYDRMISERKQIAERYRSEGREIEADWMGKIEKEQNEIASQAYRQAEETKGKADAEAARIYAEVYGKDPEFYSLWKTLRIYREGLGPNATLILGTDSDLFRYLREAGVATEAVGPGGG